MKTTCVYIYIYYDSVLLYTRNEAANNNVHARNSAAHCCYSHISVAMSEWYLCTNMFHAVDAYDQLGVPPGPSDLGSTPIQRVMKLSTVPKQHIDDCYARTMESVEKDSNEAKQIAEAYALLQGEARKAYDMKLLGAVSVTLWHQAIFYLHQNLCLYICLLTCIYIYMYVCTANLLCIYMYCHNK